MEERDEGGWEGLLGVREPYHRAVGAGGAGELGPCAAVKTCVTRGLWGGPIVGGMGDRWQLVVWVNGDGWL